MHRAPIRSPRLHLFQPMNAYPACSLASTMRILVGMRRIQSRSELFQTLTSHHGLPLHLQYLFHSQLVPIQCGTLINIIGATIFVILRSTQLLHVISPLPLRHGPRMALYQLIQQIHPRHLHEAESPSLRGRLVMIRRKSTCVHRWDGSEMAARHVALVASSFAVVLCLSHLRYRSICFW
jgi:hypothetical protein